MDQEKSDKSFFTSFTGVLLLIVSYGIAHSAMRLFATWNLGENDPVSLLKVQTFDLLVQSGAHPFDVLTFGLTEVLGENALVFQILRYGLLAIALLFVFLVSRRVSRSGVWALLTIGAYGLIYQISWRLHEGFTYPLITMVAIAGTFWAFGRAGLALVNGFWLALFIGLGLLSGLWFWVFLPALAIGALFTWPKHAALPRLIVLGGGLLAVALIVNFAITNEWPVYESLFSGVGNAALKSLAYLSPLLPILVLLFMPEFFTIVEGERKEITIIRISTIVIIGALLIAGAVMGVTNYSERALMPVLFLTPIWLLDRLRRGFPSERRIRLFAFLCLSLMVVAFVSRAANFYVLDPVCNRCYFGIPFKGLSEELAKRFDTKPHYRVVTPDPRIGGHLVAHWPAEEKPLVFAGANKLDLSEDPRPTIAVWPVRNNTEIAAYDRGVNDWLKQLGVDDAEARRALRHKNVISVGWPHIWRENGYRSSRWVATRLYRKKP